MKSPSLFLAVLLLGSSPRALASPQAPAECVEWRECRELALEARARGDHELFHDLAWRAVQTRGRRDPDLMFILARAQSLSGRPHDAMVTLERLATELGAVFDVTAVDDFQRVKALPAWPEAQARVAAVATSGSAPTTAAPATPLASTPADRPATPALDARPPSPAANPARPSSGASVEVARFSAPRFDAGGLAYDAVSRRFVIGNLPERKLTIVAEGTNRSATLSGAAAQLLSVRAIDIDRGQGDLWVVSAGARNGSGDETSELHKLQLVSGRVLAVFTPPPSRGPTRFADVVVSRGVGVLVLDAEGPRLLRPSADGATRSLEQVAALPAGEAASLAARPDEPVVYIAYRDRLVRFDLTTGSASRVAGAKNVELAGLERIRWHRGSLAGIRSNGGRRAIVKVRLDRKGARAVAVQTLDDQADYAADVVAVDVVEDDFYYLVRGGSEAVIRRVRLR